MSKTTTEDNEKREMIATTTKKSGPASSAEQAKAQLIELIQVRLADFIAEQMCALEKEGDAYYASDEDEDEDEDEFLYKAVKRSGWTDNKKVGVDAMRLSVNFSVYMEDQGEGDVAYVTMHITPSIRVEEVDFVTGRPTGVSNQEFRDCESISLDLSVV